MRKLIATLVLMAASIPAAPSIAAEWPSAGFSHTVAAVAGEPVVPVRGGMGMAGGGGMGMAGGGGMGMGGGGGMGMGGSASMGNGTPASGLPSGGSSTGSAQSADHAGCMAAQPSDTSWL